MGFMVTAAYAPADGDEYVAYQRRLDGELARLRAEGRLPDNDSVEAFLDQLRRIVRIIASDVISARSRGETDVVSRFEMTAAEFRSRRDMNDSLRNLLEILQMRQALDMQRTAGAGRVADALGAATFQE
ncbi:MAG: hypothetical protein M3N21_00220 [Actinomycetota bacterium]|nr:hypothetical protein [Actinomycetota bacterium]